MDTQKNNSQAPVEKRKRKSILFPILLAIALIIIAGLIIWLYSSRSDLSFLEQEKEAQRVELQSELDSLLVEHELVKEEYGELADSLSIKDSVIMANAREIRKLLDTQWEYYKIKKKMARLQVISQGYILQMDSLYTENKALTEENVSIKRDLQQVKREKAEISRDVEELEEKVVQASVLQAYNFKAEGLKTGSRSDKSSDKAKRVDKIKVCFTLAKNDIIPAGEKEVYVRIARPDKQILTKDRSNTYTFEYQGEMIQYSMTETVNYTNNAYDICLDWKKKYDGQPILIGTYHVDVFADGEVIGHTTFTLR